MKKPCENCKTCCRWQDDDKVRIAMLQEENRHLKKSISRIHRGSHAGTCIAGSKMRMHGCIVRVYPPAQRRQGCRKIDRGEDLK